MKKAKPCLKSILKPRVCNPVSQPTKPVPVGNGNTVLCNYLNENNINEEKCENLRPKIHNKDSGYSFLIKPN